MKAAIAFLFGVGVTLLFYTFADRYRYGYAYYCGQIHALAELGSERAQTLAEPHAGNCDVIRKGVKAI